MKKDYTVFRDREAFGKAEMIQEGLYYRIEIQCANPARIHLVCASGRMDLGVCVPSEGKFIIRTRIPVKKFGKGQICFLVASDERSFYAISEDQPFLRLDLLRSCAFATRDGKPGVQRVISRPTGQ